MAVRHLEFLKVRNFNFLSASEAKYASSYLISRRSVVPFRRYCRFSIFQNGGRGHLGFRKFQIFNCWDAQESRTASACQILSKSLKPRLRYGDFFHFLRWRPSAILDFQKLKISTSGLIRRPNVRHRTTFREERLNRSRDIADFRFLKMAAVRHLGLGLRVLGPPTKSIWWTLWLCKIWW